MNTPTTSFLVAALLSVGTSASRCESDGFLANAPGFRPTISVSDVLVERPVLDDRGRVPKPAATAARERVSVTVVANLEGGAETLAATNPYTEVRLAVGDLVIGRCLGEDPDYTAGRTQALFPLVDETTGRDGRVVRRTIGRLAFVWNARRLAVTLTCTDLDAAGLASICARDLAKAGRGKVADAPVTVALEFGGFAGARTAYLDGTVRIETRRYGTADRTAPADLDLASVTLAGKADTTSPLASIVFTPATDSMGRLSLGGFASDPNGVAIKSVTVNGSEVDSPAITFGKPDPKGICTWRVDGLCLAAGVNDVVVTLADADGNERVFNKRVVVNAR